MTAHSPRTIAVVTGTRAEFGLLLPIMRAIAAHPALRLQVIATGTHLLTNPGTLAEVRAVFPDAAVVPMYDPTHTGRSADAAALGRGTTALAEHFAKARPDIVLVLGDRIEALAATLAATVSGIRVAHVHGGDRAEGQTDESIRHAVSKLAHLHFPATPASSHRLVAMGEESRRIHVAGSPAVDGLREIPPMSDSEFALNGSPSVIFLLHPTSDDEDLEHERAGTLIRACRDAGATLLLDPNHDPGRAGILKAIAESELPRIDHLPRTGFIGLLKRAHLLVGNSSAGLIECAALGLRVVNVGSRQNGRETPANVTTIHDWDFIAVQRAIHEQLAQARKYGALQCHHPYGDGHAGSVIADALSRADLTRYPHTKLNTY
ncbi:MAG TPA: UDP-N-acetylglucosamine 2-epimerase [Phycisphaerales bacterium]|nr:UDP-N-acetylglucosamine 2-epimerase [Phycisphaerales bacterium]